MSQHYYADGAKHFDHHKEMNVQINGNASDEQLAKLAKGFFADDEDADAEEVEDMTDLFHFIHPVVTDDKERVQIHKEVENLVCNNTIPNICMYLNEMAAAKRILQPIEPKIAMTELRRMGMPGEDAQGFSEKNFQKYYRK